MPEFQSMDNRRKKILHSVQKDTFIEVVDQGEYRSLYFKNSVVQSRLYHQAPEKLALRYTQYMMAAALLSIPDPARVLLIGVGAGALLHFFNHYLQGTPIDGVDNSDHIIKIARGFFSLPENNHISIHCEDGLKYLSTLKNSISYDLILVDAFNDDGMAKSIYSSEFFKVAEKKLTKRGVICCNLWSGDHGTFTRVQKAMQKHSASRVYIPVRQRENVIALLFQTELPWQTLCPSKDVLHGLSDKYDIDFREVSAATRKHNMKIGEQMKLWFS
jgi:spermidine synthase